MTKREKKGGARSGIGEKKGVVEGRNGGDAG
jgi:hypothetical protein